MEALYKKTYQSCMLLNETTLIAAICMGHSATGMQGSRWRSKYSPNLKNKHIWLNKKQSGEKSVANF